MKQKIQHQLEQHVESQLKLRLLRKAHNSQVDEQQHQNHQPLQIQDLTLNAKKKDSIHIQEIAKNIFGVWIADHRILESFHINSHAHLV